MLINDQCTRTCDIVKRNKYCLSVSLYKHRIKSYKGTYLTASYLFINITNCGHNYLYTLQYIWLHETFFLRLSGLYNR